MEDELLKVNEVAQILRITRKSVYDLMKAGLLPYVVVGVSRGRRIRRSALNAFLGDKNRGVYNDGASDVKSEDARMPTLGRPLLEV